jgi:hypothetical protein
MEERCRALLHVLGLVRGHRTRRRRRASCIPTEERCRRGHAYSQMLHACHWRKTRWRRTHSCPPPAASLPPSLPSQPLFVHCSPSNPCSSISPPVTMTTFTRALLVLGASIRQVKALTHHLQVIALLQVMAFARLLPIQPQLLNGAPVEMATVGCISYFCKSASGFFTLSRDGDTACQRQRICEW